jgi:hypothetical protein
MDPNRRRKLENGKNKAIYNTLQGAKTRWSCGKNANRRIAQKIATATMEGTRKRGRPRKNRRTRLKRI